MYILNWQYLHSNSLQAMITLQDTSPLGLAGGQDNPFTRCSLALFLEVQHNLYCFFFIFVLNLILKAVFQDTRCPYPQWQLTRKTSFSVHIPELDDPKEKVGCGWNSVDINFDLNSEMIIFPVNYC